RSFESHRRPHRNICSSVFLKKSFVCAGTQVESSTLREGNTNDEISPSRCHPDLCVSRANAHRATTTARYAKARSDRRNRQASNSDPADGGRDFQLQRTWFSGVRDFAIRHRYPRKKWVQD